jgi:centromere-localized protein 2
MRSPKMTSETTLLKSFLLTPSSLPESLTIQQFTELFPTRHQGDSTIPSLYRELQHQRAQDIDDVKRNINTEIAQGEKQKRLIKRGRRRWQESDLEGLDEKDVRMEADVTVQSISSIAMANTHSAYSS